MHDGFGRDVAACPGPVVDDERLAESIRQLLAQQPCHDVGRAAGRKTDENAHRPRRIGLRESKARDSWQRGGARGQMQEFAAGKFQLEPPLASHHSITSSARASSVSGTSRPIAFAVLRFSTVSYFVGA